jgi:hypothetical protein
MLQHIAYCWKRGVRRVGGYQDQVDVICTNICFFQCFSACFIAEVTGSLVWQRMPTFHDSRSANDPVNIAVKVLAQDIVRDQPIRYVLATTENTHARNAAAGQPKVHGWRCSVGYGLAIMLHQGTTQ